MLVWEKTAIYLFNGVSLEENPFGSECARKLCKILRAVVMRNAILITSDDAFGFV